MPPRNLCHAASSDVPPCPAPARPRQRTEQTCAVRPLPLLLLLMLLALRDDAKGAADAACAAEPQRTSCCCCCCNLTHWQAAAGTVLSFCSYSLLAACIVGMLDGALLGCGVGYN